MREPVSDRQPEEQGKHMDSLQDKVAVITGAGSGIGRAIARRAAEQGMKLALADIEKAALDDVCAELGEHVEVLGVPTDVSDLAAVEALRDATVDRFGTVHLLCNNAGVGGGGRIWEIPIETWNWVLGVDLWSVVYGIRTFVPLMIEQNEGHVVNTASMAGLVSGPGMGPYMVAKHGVVAMSETLFHDLRFVQSAVGVSVLCPSFVNTRIHESNRNAPADVIARYEDQPEREVNVNMRAMVTSLIENGLDPNKVADAVIDAVQARRFYILTHPESVEWVRRKMNNILDGQDPSGGLA
jgi:NAD(P)-dependent dehydrogenase (short-subunit alcohol dehydrogenase family)